ncbi:MAG TPA: metallophosphoesterase [Thermotogota bacterium]|nr:metallophosphoesterase [Thermotogota bacterium]HPJ90240.1 metallophosphoesterase [Thermotogota bacterium]
MKNYKIPFLTITLFLLFMMSSFSESIPVDTDGNTCNIAIFSDPHYFSTKLNTDSELFREYLLKDRKLLHLSTEITEELIKKISDGAYDLVIIPGDLTKDGEKEGHSEFVLQLEKLQAAGKKVFVICGNHDINNPSAIRIEGEQVLPVESVTADEFRQIYHEMGYSQAIATDSDSLSYVCEPLSWLRIIAMDSCYYDANYENGHAYTGGFFSEETLNWILKMIHEGKEKGQLVLGFMHHGLVPHLSIQEHYFPEYLIKDWQQIAEAFADAGMNLVFTGHFHAQDISQHTSPSGNTLWDVQTGSLVTYPIPYRSITLSQGGTLTITSHVIQKTDSVPDLHQYAKNFLDQELMTLLPEKAAEKIVDFGIPESFAQAYVTSLLKTRGGEFTLLEIAVKVVIAFYAGNEAVSPELIAAVNELKDNGDNQFLALFGTLAESFLTDTIPQDNNLTIHLK